MVHTVSQGQSDLEWMGMEGPPLGEVPQRRQFWDRQLHGAMGTAVATETTGVAAMEAAATAVNEAATESSSVATTTPSPERSGVRTATVRRSLPGSGHRLNGAVPWRKIAPLMEPDLGSLPRRRRHDAGEAGMSPRKWWR